MATRYGPPRLVLFDESDILQGAQDAVHGALGQTERRGDLGEADRLVLLGQQSQDRGGALHRLHASRHGVRLPPPVAGRGGEVAPPAFGNVERSVLWWASIGGYGRDPMGTGP